MVLPKITVITPTFNAGDVIETAILSVANQRYANIEHILVDNKSKDQTLPTIRKYQKIYKNIRLLTEKDEGLYYAINKGMDLCTGDWIFFLGADDSFYSENTLTELFDLGLFQEEQVVYGNVLIKGDAPWARDGSVYDGPFTLEKLFKGNICHQSIFYPRSVIRQVGYYNTRYKVTADWDYNMRCWAKYNFTFTDKIIAFFQTGGVSSKGDDYSLQMDLPGNIIKYFQLDVNDQSLYFASSPFYYPISRYRENESVKTIQGLEAEIGRLKQQLISEQNNHAESVALIQTEHDINVSILKAGHSESISMLESDYSLIIKSLQDELNAIKVLLDQKESDLHEIIESNKQQTEHLRLTLESREHHFGETVDKYNSEITNLQAEIESNKQKTEHLRLTLESREHQFGETVDKYTSEITNLKVELESREHQFGETVDKYNSEITNLQAEIESNKQQTEHWRLALEKLEHHFSETVEKYNNEIADLKVEIESKKQDINTILTSYTWKTGKALLSPIQLFIAKK